MNWKTFGYLDNHFRTSIRVFPEQYYPQRNQHVIIKNTLAGLRSNLILSIKYSHGGTGWMNYCTNLNNGVGVRSIGFASNLIGLVTGNFFQEDG
jgi:hypothetical protein